MLEKILTKYDKYIKGMSKNEDEASEAKLAIMRILDSVETHPNPKGYIISTIKFAIHRLRTKDALIPIPPWYWRYQKDHGNDVLVPICPVAEADRPVEDKSDLMMEEIYSYCKDEKDKAIIKMRKDGYTDYEIADILGIPRITITYRRNKIKKAFENGEL